MNDEILMKFIDGTATQEEVDAVIEHLSGDDSMINEWIQMSQARLMTDVKPAVNISEQDASDFVSGILHQTTRRNVRTLPWIVGFTVAVAASVAVFVNIPHVGSDVDSMTDSYAEVLEKQDEPLSKDVLLNEEMHCEESMIEEQTYPKTSEEQKVKIPQIRHDSNASAEKVAGCSFRMLKPAKTPYKIRVKNLEGEFVFDWESEGVDEVIVSISDMDGNDVMNLAVDGTSESQCPVKVKTLTEKGVLDWSILVKGYDGTLQNHKGKIEFVYIPE